MKELSIITHNGIETVDSREVAQAIESRHSDLLEKINNYNSFLANGKFRSLDFFIPDTYTDGQGKPRPCYLLTKKGCDMVANKMTGEKGVLFTAARMPYASPKISIFLLTFWATSFIFYLWATRSEVKQ